MTVMMDYITSLTIMLLTLTSVTSQKQMTEEACIKTKGTCKVITDCEYAKNLLHNISISSGPAANITRQKLRSMLCGFNDRNPKVCCPNAPPNSGLIVYNKSEETATNRPKPSTTPLVDLVQRTTSTVRTTEAAITEIPEETESPAVMADPFPDRKICGQLTGSDRIIGGEIAAIDEFPWMALVKYSDDENNTRLSCSATLITDRHLLSAAHCFVGHNLKPVSVRLGEWNTESPGECNDGFCADPPVEIEIESIRTFPGFTKRVISKWDIAVIKLKNSVNFTEFIQPICLPTTEYIKMQDYTRDSSYMTAGWGVTEFDEPSKVKRKVAVEAVPIDICRAALSQIPESSSEILICAGGRKGKDSCRGDSGGPLMRLVMENYSLNWFLYGITSFGGTQCGKAGIPGVYTRVTRYMEWIRENVQT